MNFNHKTAPTKEEIGSLSITFKSGDKKEKITLDMKVKVVLHIDGSILSKS
jgi:hypothetical protein